MTMNAKSARQARYDKANTRTYAIKVIKTTEADIYNHLEGIENKSGYIKSLIRADIENFNKTLDEYK